MNPWVKLLRVARRAKQAQTDIPPGWSSEEFTDYAIEVARMLAKKSGRQAGVGWVKKMLLGAEVEPGWPADHAADWILHDVERGYGGVSIDGHKQRLAQSRFDGSDVQGIWKIVQQAGADTDGAAAALQEKYGLPEDCAWDIADHATDEDRVRHYLENYDLLKEAQKKAQYGSAKNWGVEQGKVEGKSYASERQRAGDNSIDEYMRSADAELERLEQDFGALPEVYREAWIGGFIEQLSKFRIGRRAQYLGDPSFQGEVKKILWGKYQVSLESDKMLQELMMEAGSRLGEQATDPNEMALEIAVFINTNDWTPSVGDDKEARDYGHEASGRVARVTDLKDDKRGESMNHWAQMARQAQYRGDDESWSVERMAEDAADVAKREDAQGAGLMSESECQNYASNVADMLVGDGRLKEGNKDNFVKVFCAKYPRSKTAQADVEEYATYTVRDKNGGESEVEVYDIKGDTVTLQSQVGTDQRVGPTRWQESMDEFKGRIVRKAQGGWDEIKTEKGKQKVFVPGRSVAELFERGMTPEQIAEELGEPLDLVKQDIADLEKGASRVVWGAMARRAQEVPVEAPPAEVAAQPVPEAAPAAPVGAPAAPAQPQVAEEPVDPVALGLGEVQRTCDLVSKRLKEMKDVGPDGAWLSQNYIAQSKADLQRASELLESIEGMYAQEGNGQEQEPKEASRRKAQDDHQDKIDQAASDAAEREFQRQVGEVKDFNSYKQDVRTFGRAVLPDANGRDIRQAAEEDFKADLGAGKVAEGDKDEYIEIYKQHYGAAMDRQASRRRGNAGRNMVLLARKRIVFLENKLMATAAHYKRAEEWGVRYTVFAGREGRLTPKQKIFDSPDKLRRFVKKIQEDGNFYRIDSWLGPEMFTGFDADEFMRGGARVAVTPPGKEKMVKELKKNPDVDNPWAVAWAQYNKEQDKKEGRRVAKPSKTGSEMSSGISVGDVWRREDGLEITIEKISDDSVDYSTKAGDSYNAGLNSFEDSLEGAVLVKKARRVAFQNGDRVKLVKEYAEPSNPNEVFTLSQWDPERQRGWIGDKDGSGWYVTPDQIEMAKEGSRRVALSLPEVVKEIREDFGYFDDSALKQWLEENEGRLSDQEKEMVQNYMTASRRGQAENDPIEERPDPGEQRITPEDKYMNMPAPPDPEKPDPRVYPLPPTQPPYMVLPDTSIKASRWGQQGLDVQEGDILKIKQSGGGKAVYKVEKIEGDQVTLVSQEKLGPGYESMGQTRVTNTMSQVQDMLASGDAKRASRILPQAVPWNILESEIRRASASGISKEAIAQMLGAPVEVVAEVAGKHAQSTDSLAQEILGDIESMSRDGNTDAQIIAELVQNFGLSAKGAGDCLGATDVEDIKDILKRPNVLEANRRAKKTPMECLECGHKFSKNVTSDTYEVRCPKCGGYDTDVA